MDIPKTELTSNSIKKCPFCGHDARLQTYIFERRFFADDEMVFVECGYCGARGPSKKINAYTAAADEAKEEWNKRPLDIPPTHVEILKDLSEQFDVMPFKLFEEDGILALLTDKWNSIKQIVVKPDDGETKRVFEEVKDEQNRN